MSTRPATIVGSANGMSMITSITRWPGNRSRTSTQAMSVPTAAFTTVTSSEAPTVRRIVDSASALVMSSQKVPTPSWNELTTIAAIGSSTMRLSHSTPTPSPRPAAGVRPPLVAPRAHREIAVGAGAGPWSVMVTRWLPVAPELRDETLLLVEELVVHGLPAAEVVDRGERRDRRERARRIVGTLDVLDRARAAVDRAETLGAQDVLAVGAL